jgi:copper chaperone
MSNTHQPTITEQYLVEGMTCSHCVASVTEEVSAIAGVASVSIDLLVGGASTVVVVSDHALAPDDVRDAVTEAGYSLVSA